MVASLSAGPYKIDFSYTIDAEGELVTAAARLWQQGDARTLSCVYYTYDDAGRLRAVSQERDSEGLAQAQARYVPASAF
jgi:hypothetical protein